MTDRQKQVFRILLKGRGITTKEAADKHCGTECRKIISDLKNKLGCKFSDSWETKGKYRFKRYFLVSYPEDIYER